MRDEKIIELLNKFGVEPISLLPAIKGYRNESHPFKISSDRLLNLIIYKSENNILDKINSANSVSEYLSEMGLPSRKMADKRILKIGLNRYCVIYSFLPGETIPWEAYTMKHLKLLGAVMSNMHKLLSSFSGDNLPTVAERYMPLVDRMIIYFDSRGVKSAMSSKLNLQINKTQLENLRTLLGIAIKLPENQALHLDFVRGNILFDNDASGNLAISGIIDFEKTAIGNKVFDIARTLAFLLVDCRYKTETEIRKYFLISGYNKRGQSKFRQLEIYYKNNKINIFEELINFYLVYDFYKFLLHNPYQSLDKNHHYLITKDLILNRTSVLKSLINLSPNGRI